MKQKQKTSHWLTSTAAALALASSTTFADQFICSFDTDQCGASSGGGVAKTITYDAAVGNPAGSVNLVIEWANATGWQDSKYQWGTGWPGIDCRQFLNLEFDIKVDTANSTLTDSGSYGGVQVVCQGWNGAGDNGPGLDWVGIGGVTIAGTNTWQHFSVSLAGFPHYVNNFVINFNANQYGPTNVVHAGNCTYWLDNVKFTSPPLAPPTLQAPLPPTPTGLTLNPITGGQWQRVMVYPGPLGSDFGWYNNTAPVTYSFTVGNFPTQSEYAANLFLVPNISMPYGAGDTAMDWNCTNGLFFNFTANATSPATNWNVGLSAKTNAGGANPNVNLLSFNYPVLPNGNWTLRFANNTNLTITAPNGFTTNYNIAEEVVNFASGNYAGDTRLTPYVGIMNRAIANIGVPTVFSHIGITNDTHSVSDNFCPSGFDTNTWSKLTDDQSDIFVNCGDLMGFVRWTAPNDQGYSALQLAPSVTGPWRDYSPNTSWHLVQASPKMAREVNLSKSGVHAFMGGAETNALYYRLVKRVFSKLQVLMPGETAAPDTLSGKTGSPTPQTAGVPFDVIVKAVDQNWHVMTSAIDTIQVTSSDGTATLPADAALSLGTATFSVTFGSTGNWTVTATDVTDGTKTPNTGTPTTTN